MYRPIEQTTEPTIFHKHPGLIQLIQYQLDQFSKNESLKPIRYPWNDLQLSNSTLHLVGYGSLISRASAARTLHYSDLASSCPVYAFGARRLYNYIMSPSGVSRYNAPTSPKERGVLNTISTGSADDFFNGVSLRIHGKDMKRFCEREFAYDLIPVVTLPWNDPQGPMEIAYTLSCRETYCQGRKMLSNSLAPHPSYHDLCVDACRTISEDFLNCFWQTTWISELGTDPAAMPSIDRSGSNDQSPLEVVTTGQ